MATTSVTAGKQARATTSLESSWTAARDAASSNTSTTYSTATDVGDALEVLYNAGARGNLWAVGRAFFYFDVSSVPGTITALELKIYGVTNGESDAIAVKSTAFSGDGSTNYSDDEFDSWTPDSPTDYSGKTSGWTTGGFNNITLNSTAVSDANSNGLLIIALVDYDFDYTDLDPASVYPTGNTLNDVLDLLIVPNLST